MKLSPRLYRLGAAPASLALAALVLSFPSVAHPQGCVAAHSPQPIISGLNPTSELGSRSFAHGDWLHGLTITTGFRTYNSFRHYVGTVYQVQRQTNHNAVVNHVDLFELDLNYQLTPRVSMIATIPGMEATRHGQSSATNFYRSGGIGDVTVGVQSWIWRPPTESHGNINFSAQLKLPTGINDAKGTTITKSGVAQTEPFDESIQPGDGRGDSRWPPRHIASSGCTPPAISPAPGSSAPRTRPAFKHSGPHQEKMLSLQRINTCGAEASRIPLRISKYCADCRSALADAWRACRSAMPLARATVFAGPAMSFRSSPA